MKRTSPVPLFHLYMLFIFVATFCWLFFFLLFLLLWTLENVIIILCIFAPTSPSWFCWFECNTKICVLLLYVHCMSCWVIVCLDQYPVLSKRYMHIFIFDQSVYLKKCKRVPQCKHAWRYSLCRMQTRWWIFWRRRRWWIWNESNGWSWTFLHMQRTHYYSLPSNSSTCHSTWKKWFTCNKWIHYYISNMLLPLPSVCNQMLLQFLSINFDHKMWADFKKLIRTNDISHAHCSYANSERSVEPLEFRWWWLRMNKKNLYIHSTCRQINSPPFSPAPLLPSAFGEFCFGFGVSSLVDLWW